MCDKRKSLTLREAAELLNILPFPAQDCLIAKHLCISLQYSVYKALKLNSKFIFSYKKFSNFLEFIKHKDKEIANIFYNKIVKEVWNLKKKHFINKTMRKETKAKSHSSCSKTIQIGNTN